MENTVIINSIGTANPSVSKLLADSFKMPQEFILKMLYNAPSVLFQKIDLDLAEKAASTLTKLGLDVQVTDEKEKLNLSKEQVEISIYFEDILRLPKVIHQLSEFLGCKPSESLNMLLAQPGIVLGGVSKATAIALQNRLDALVCYSNPRKDLFSIYISDEFPKSDLKRLTTKVKQPFKNLVNGASVLKDLSFAESSSIWREHQSKKGIRVINQTHQLVTINLTSFDSKNTQHVSFLTEKIGMPSTILSDLKQHLPITLFDRISNKSAQKTIEDCKEIGLEISVENNFKTTRELVVDEIKDHAAVKEILAQFIDVSSFKENTNHWKSSTKIPDLIANYLYAQLVLLNCEPTLI